MESANVTVGCRVPWNKGKLTGQKPPLKLGEIWAIRTRLKMASNVRELAIFNLAIDSKLRACDLTRLQVQDIRPRKPRGLGIHRPATEDPASSPTRDYRSSV